MLKLNLLKANLLKLNRLNLNSLNLNLLNAKLLNLNLLNAEFLHFLVSQPTSHKPFLGLSYCHSSIFDLGPLMASSSAAQPSSSAAQPDDLHTGLMVAWVEVSANLHQLQCGKQKELLRNLVEQMVETKLEILGLTDIRRSAAQPACANERQREEENSNAVEETLDLICGDILRKAAYSVYTTSQCAVLLSANAAGALDTTQKAEDGKSISVGLRWENYMFWWTAATWQGITPLQKIH